MKMWVKVLLVTLVIGVPAIPLGQVIWPSPAGGVGPTGVQLPFFIVLGVVEGLLFGLGIAFLLFGFPFVRSISDGSRRTWASFLGIAWLMVSWWPHDGLHRSMPEGNFTSLLFIEYGFHLTLMATGLLLAYNFVRVLQARGVGQKATTGAIDAIRVAQAGTTQSI